MRLRTLPAVFFARLPSHSRNGVGVKEDSCKIWELKAEAAIHIGLRGMAGGCRQTMDNGPGMESILFSCRAVKD